MGQWFRVCFTVSVLMKSVLLILNATAYYQYELYELCVPKENALSSSSVAILIKIHYIDEYIRLVYNIS